MSNVVNLNRTRKAKAATARVAEATVNRIRFGKTKAMTARDLAVADKAAAEFAGKRLERDE